MHCFARASLPRMVAICEAFHLREVARAKADVAPKKAQKDAFYTAADAFTRSGNDAPPGKDKIQYYRNAAECYVRAGDDRKAAMVYLSAQEYDLAAQRFRKAGLFDETLEVLHKHSPKIPSESSEDLYTVCRLFYCSKRDGMRCMLCDLHVQRHLANITELGHISHCSHHLKKNWNSTKTTTSTLLGLRCWSLTEDIWKRLNFICWRTGPSTQLETS